MRLPPSLRLETRLNQLCTHLRLLLTCTGLWVPTVASAQTPPAAPSPLPLPISQDFGTTAFSELPTGFVAWAGMDGDDINTQLLAETSIPTSLATLDPKTAATTTGGTFGYAIAGNAKFYVQTSSSTTMGVNQLAMGLNCANKQAITVGYTLDIISAQVRTVGIVCQYRVGGTNSWTTVIPTAGSNPFSQAAGTAGLKTTVTAILPAAANNQPVVQLRWASWRGTETGSSSGFAIDNITVSGVPTGGPDITAPIIATLSPTNNQNLIAIDTDLTATFSEAITVATGNIFIRKVSDQSIVLTLPITDPSISGSGTSTLTINPAANLTAATAYYIEIVSGAITDLAGNSFAGIVGSATWKFTTAAPDLAGPLLLNTLPAHTATGVKPAGPLTLTFNESVQVPLFTGPMIRIKNATGTVATIDPSPFGSSGAVVVNGAVVTVKLPSSMPLDYGVNYYVEIDSGAFEDLSANPYTGWLGSGNWSFTTLDVPAMTGGPYQQSFSSYLSADTLPAGWSAMGAADYLSNYTGNWGTSSSGGFRGGASIYGYQHTNLTLTAAVPLQQILTLRNNTGSAISQLTLAYQGRAEIPVNTRNSSYTVSVAGTDVPALAYSTADGDHAQRNASVSGLNIASGATFQVKWSSSQPNGGGSTRQIGISEVALSLGSSIFPPTVAGLSVPALKVGSSAVTVNANVNSDGGSLLTARGFVYAVTTLNPMPQIDGANVVVSTNALSVAGSYTASLTGLTENTNYTVRAYARNSLGISYTAAVLFTTLAPPPIFVSNYTQEFDNYMGTNPTGWTTISDSLTPILNYTGTWGTGSASGGFLGGVAAPGVLGYRHTSGTGNLNVMLRLVNGTGANLTSLHVSYLGRAMVSNTSPEGRSPQWTVAVTNGATHTAVPGLGYSTALGLDAAVSTMITGLTIAPGAEFSLTWASDRGLAGTGFSKQIGIARVVIGLSAAVGYQTWNSVNAGGQGPLLDFDHDGVANGVEYFFGATGSSFTRNPQPNAAGKISFPHPVATPGATYRVFTSSNLTNWTDVTATTVVEPAAVSYTLPAGQGKIFARLQVVIAP